MLFRFVILLVALWVPSLPAFSADLVLSDDGLAAGYATLSWQEVEGNKFELKENTPTGWHTIYSGGDRASTLSGLRDGTYEFALWVDGQPYGAPLVLTVSHHPLGRAWMFFGVGALMFMALVALLIRRAGDHGPTGPKSKQET